MSSLVSNKNLSQKIASSSLSPETVIVSVSLRRNMIVGFILIEAKNCRGSEVASKAAMICLKIS